MTDELGRRVDAVSERIPEGTPDLASVVEGGRRAKRRRAIAGTAGIVGLISLVTLAALNLDFDTGDPAPVQPATHEDGVFVPAERGDSTYVLTNFRVEYPWAEVDGLPGMRPGSERRELYCDMPSRNAACESKGNAGFFYGFEWSTDRYPGVVQCRVVLYSKAGRQVGREIWELSALEPRDRQIQPLLVPVTGEPHSAEASCEGGSYGGGPGYRATLVAMEPLSSTSTQLTFDIEHLTKHTPDERMCTLRVTLESGKRNPDASFTLTTPERPITLRAPHPSDDDVADASLTCKAFKKSGKP